MGRPALWHGIRDQLERDIAAGRYQEHDRLPTEAALSTRFGVNRHTVRRAVADLCARGIVHTRRGAGIFVTHAPTEYPIGSRVRFHQNIMAGGQTPKKAFLLLESRASDPAEASWLALEHGAQVHVCEGLSFADEAPIALFRSVFAAGRTPGILDHLKDTTSITEALALAGITDYTRAWTRIDAKIAPPALAGHLRLQAGAPILRTTSLNVDTDGQPIEYGRSWFAADRVTLTVDGSHPT
ncbi:MAG: phosphonate metabolism transcriptional regulator PhnF [Pseudomonadota bacterium]